MRPTGVYRRFLELKDEEWARVRARPEDEFRILLMTFLNLSGRLRFYDLSERAVLAAFHMAYAVAEDPTQRRTGSGFEHRSIECLRRLHPLIGDYAAGLPDTASVEVEDALRESLVVVPATVLLGQAGVEQSFRLVCWNTASCLAEGIGTPYLAARTIANMGHHDRTGQLDVYGLVAPLTELAERSEDHPDQRTAAAAEITAVLTNFLAIAEAA
jgi:hypothetical protein